MNDRSGVTDWSLTSHFGFQLAFALEFQHPPIGFPYRTAKSEHKPGSAQLLEKQDSLRDASCRLGQAALLKMKKISNSWPVLVLALSLSAHAQVPPNVGELFASEATPNGPLMKAGTGLPVASGSELSAGKSPATLRLDRGGEVKICPNSQLSVTGSSSNAALLFALSVSTAEMSYPINELSDTLITPDFRLSLTGPGTFHFAVGVNSRGDTCIRPLLGNSGVIVISELTDSGAFLLKADESVLFAGGKVSGRGPLTSPCGCPPPVPAIQEEVATPAQTVTQPGQPVPLPTKSPGEVHVSVEAPLVFRGDQPGQEIYTVAKVNFSKLPNTFLLQEKVEPAIPDDKPENKGETPKKTQPPKERKGFLGSIRSFFASIFHR